MAGTGPMGCSPRSSNSPEDILTMARMHIHLVERWLLDSWSRYKSDDTDIQGNRSKGGQYVRKTREDLAFMKLSLSDAGVCRQVSHNTHTSFWDSGLRYISQWWVLERKRESCCCVFLFIFFHTSASGGLVLWRWCRVFSILIFLFCFCFYIFYTSCIVEVDVLVLSRWWPLISFYFSILMYSCCCCCCVFVFIFFVLHKLCCGGGDRWFFYSSILIRMYFCYCAFVFILFVLWRHLCSGGGDGWLGDHLATRTLIPSRKSNFS